MTTYSQQDVGELAQLMRLSRERGKSFAILAGAGCSVSGGIPAAGAMAKQIRRMFGGIHDERPQAQRADYAACIAGLNPGERRKFLKPILDAARPSRSHLAVASLMSFGLVGRVLTLNFDDLFERACALCGIGVAIHDLAAARLHNADHLATPSLIHLHGQGTGLAAFLTDNEAEQHADTVEPVLIDTLERFPLLVIGYSGREDMIYPRLLANYRGRDRLFWISHRRTLAEPHVRALINKAPTAARHLSSQDSDSFLTDLATALGCWPPRVLTDPEAALRGLLANGVPLDWARSSPPPAALPESRDSNLVLPEEDQQLAAMTLPWPPTRPAWRTGAGPMREEPEQAEDTSPAGSESGNGELAEETRTEAEEEEVLIIARNAEAPAEPEEGTATFAADLAEKAEDDAAARDIDTAPSGADDEIAAGEPAEESLSGVAQPPELKGTIESESVGEETAIESGDTGLVEALAATAQEGGESDHATGPEERAAVAVEAAAEEVEIEAQSPARSGSPVEEPAETDAGQGEPEEQVAEVEAKAESSPSPEPELIAAEAEEPSAGDESQVEVEPEPVAESQPLPAQEVPEAPEPAPSSAPPAPPAAPPLPPLLQEDQLRTANVVSISAARASRDQIRPAPPRQPAAPPPVGKARPAPRRGTIPPPAGPEPVSAPPPSPSASNGQKLANILGGISRPAPEPPVGPVPPPKPAPASASASSAEQGHIDRAGVLLQRAINEKNDVLFLRCYEEYEAALKLNPSSPTTLVAWGDALFALAVRKREEVPYQQCFARYREALRLRPNVAEIHLRLAAALSNYGVRKRDQAALRTSIESFRRAAELKPALHGALVGWAGVLTQLGNMIPDEKLLGEACAKYGEAYKLRAGDTMLLANWSAALIDWWRQRGDPSLLDAAAKLLANEEQLSGKPSYNAACLAALRGDMEACRAKLEACKAAGVLPARDELLADPDLASVKDAPWFRTLAA